MWAGNMTTNTLRMLFKIRGIEEMRRQSLATGSTAHDWVLRVRPDLELLSPLELPPPAPDVVYVPWTCTDSALVFDQFLLLPSDAAISHLGTLYEPSRLVEVARRSTPPSLYPERLMHHALNTIAVHPWPGNAHLRLVGGNGEPRDAYAKLRADFASCFS